MKSQYERWLLVTVVAFGAVGLLLRNQNLHADSPKLNRQGWQYASLMTSARVSKWTSPDTQHVEEGEQGYIHLYKDLGGDKPAGKINLIDLLNLVGSQGWELIAIDGGEGPHQYIFKRTAV